MRTLITFLAFLFTQLIFSQSVNSDCLVFKNLKIVVIGSSTAQGTGASVPDSAWVNRFRNFVQNINPENEVLNLARGGYNTYRLMPQEFIPPDNRPTPDSSRNITAAVAEMPDAIILNLPSNDASSGYTVEEQLSNFDSIVNVAKRANIPIWVATTQPKNFSNDALINVQTTVRDSILSRYGENAIDFWNGLSDASGELDPSVDSGDGTHLNDTGHRLLFERVISERIPELVTFQPNSPDYEILALNAPSKVNCTNDDLFLELVFTNFGQSFLDDELNFLIQYADTTITQIIEPIPTCQIDTIRFLLLDEEVEATISSLQNADPDLTNNTARTTVEIVPSPELNFQEIGICIGESVLLNPTINNSDRIFWYENEDSANPISTDSALNIGPLFEDTTFWVEAFNGDTIDQDRLFTTDQFNRDWNGIMFDLAAEEDLMVDSFSINMFSTGAQIIEIYFRNGSLNGFESDSANWSLYLIDTLQVENSGDYVMVENLNLNIASGDTVAFYLQLQNPASDMNYFATQVNETRQSSVLSITNGTGVSHNFGETFFPRLFSGELFFHHNYRLGDCSTGRQPVTIEVKNPQVDLGPDIILTTFDTILRFEVPDIFSTYQWNNFNTTSTLEIGAEDIFTSGDSLIFVIVYDEFGCAASDTVRINFAVSNVQDSNFPNLEIFPNPMHNQLNITGIQEIIDIQITDVNGAVIFKNRQFRGGKIEVTNFPKGVYFLKIEKDKDSIYRKMIKQ